MTTADAQENKVVLDSDLTTSPFGQPVNIKTQNDQGRITGVFPQGWQDNSSWAPVSYQSRKVTQDNSTFWRINIPTPQPQRIQLRHNLPDLAGGEMVYELTLLARGNQFLEMGIRRSGAPYEFFWSTRQVLNGHWQSCQWRFKLTKPLKSQDIGLWLNITGSPAQVDIKHVKLVAYTPQQILEQAKAKYPGPGPVNLLRQSRLPLGIQTGWALHRELDDADDVQISHVSDPTSPSGWDVMRLVSEEKRIFLRGEPMTIDRHWLNHVASVYVKGNGRIQFSANSGSYYLANREIAIDSSMGWQRLVIKFKPRHDPAHPTCLTFQGKGDLRIDRLMVHSGNDAKPYQSQLPAEIALAAGDGQIASFTNTHFDNEPATFRYVCTGVPENQSAFLNLQFTNVYGRQKQQQIKLQDTNHWSGNVNYNVFEKQPYGSIHVLATITDEHGKPMSTASELVMHRLRRPHYWMMDAPDSAFGTHTLSTRRHIQMAKAVGINWTRLHDAGTQYIGWYHLEPKPGQWQFYDKELKRYRQFGMKILGLLSTAPKWASLYPGFDVNGYFDRYYMPKDFEQFANDYVKVVVKRYDKLIDAWDIWNEPWGTWWAVGYDPSKQGTDGYIQADDEVKQYAAFQKIVYNAVKQVKPEAHVTGTNSIFGEVGQAWTRGMVENGAAAFADSFAYHHYTQSYAGYPGDVVHRGLNDQVQLFPNHTLPYPAWMTEGSPVSGQIANGLYRVTLPDAEREDVMQTADSLSRYCLSMLTAGVQRFFLYSMHTHAYFGQANTWQVLVTEEGALHPCAAAVSAMAWFLEDATFKQHKSPTNGLHAWAFAGPRGNVTVLSITPGSDVAYTLPDKQGMQYFDLFGNPLAPGTPIGQTLVYQVTDGR
ncbi:MAG: hypothetical protein ACF8OB_09845 [Phycisphaeraceae bacterium JB051]